MGRWGADQGGGGETSVKPGHGEEGWWGGVCAPV